MEIGAWLFYLSVSAIVAAVFWLLNALYQALIDWYDGW